MKNHRTTFRHETPPSYRGRASRSSGSTLIEVMVALGIFALMIAIVFIPLNLGINLFHIGRARSEVQQAGQTTLSQIEREVSQAVYVYPNDLMPGVTTRAPFTRNSGLPYIRLKNPATPINSVYDGTVGVCDAPAGTEVEPVGNTSRLDFIPARKSAAGQVITPTEPSFNQVSYYARRLDVTAPYDAVDNPIVMFRAEYAHRKSQSNPGDPFNVPSPVAARNAETGSERYPTDCNANASARNRGSLWLTQTASGEPNLESLSNGVSYGPDTSPVAHTLLTPRGMGLIAPRAHLGAPNTNFTPNVSFLCEDVRPDGEPDGKIDRVTIKMELAQFDGNNSGDKDENNRPAAQSVPTQLTVELPNIR